MSLGWEIRQSNRLFHCQCVFDSQKELQPTIRLSKLLHCQWVLNSRGAPTYAQIEQAPSSMTRNVRLIRAANENGSPKVGYRTPLLLQTTCITKLMKGFYDLLWAGAWKHRRIGRRTRALPARSQHTKTINITLDSVLYENDQIDSIRGRTLTWRHHIQASQPRAKNPIITVIWIQSNRIQTPSPNQNKKKKHYLA